MEHLISTKTFPIILATLDLFAASVYLFHGDIKHGVYWLAAMTLTITVTI